MSTQIGNHVNVLPFEVAPILHSKAPNIANTYSKGILIHVESILIKDVSRLIAWIQEWASCTLSILLVAWIVAYVNLVVLKKST